MTLEWMFAVSVALAAYPMIGYPVLIGLIGLLRPRAVRRREWLPSVTVIIPAYNEARCIAATIENKLRQDYPAERLHIIVVSDASDDGTDDIVRRYAARGVELLRREVRGGKAAGLNAAVLRAPGEIIVFSDANAQFDTDGVRRMVENFADPEVGYVTGSLTYQHAGGTVAGEGGSSYMRYENWLRRAETRAGSIIGVNGGIDAMRRELYADVPADQISDFVLPLRVVAAGRRVVYDARVRSKEEANAEIGSEFRMRVRVALRALRGMWYMRAVLNPLRYPLPAFCILSHKILRYGTFLFLLVAFFTNCALARHGGLFVWLLALQLLAYGVAFLGLRERLPSVLRNVSRVPSYFLVSNIAFAIAAWRFLRGDVMATWQPRGG